MSKRNNKNNRARVSRRSLMGHLSTNTTLDEVEVPRSQMKDYCQRNHLSYPLFMFRVRYRDWIARRAG